MTFIPTCLPLTLPFSDKIVNKFRNYTHKNNIRNILESGKK